ncbi:hypothetical protein V1478_007329 [Vespula squamosa]|uniref:Uncharacterized protein n=1 Tax=Vespula squamosa TaxID=30214 RepID=A0ABD2B300_VESSQ
MGVRVVFRKRIRNDADADWIITKRIHRDELETLDAWIQVSRTEKIIGILLEDISSYDQSLRCQAECYLTQTVSISSGFSERRFNENGIRKITIFG